MRYEGEQSTQMDYREVTASSRVVDRRRLTDLEATLSGLCTHYKVESRLRMKGSDNTFEDLMNSNKVGPLALLYRSVELFSDNRQKQTKLIKFTPPPI